MQPNAWRIEWHLTVPEPPEPSVPLPTVDTFDCVKWKPKIGHLNVMLTSIVSLISFLFISFLSWVHKEKHLWEFWERPLIRII